MGRSALLVDQLFRNGEKSGKLDRDEPGCVPGWYDSKSGQFLTGRVVGVGIV